MLSQAKLHRLNQDMEGGQGNQRIRSAEFTDSSTAVERKPAINYEISGARSRWGRCLGKTARQLARISALFHRPGRTTTANRKHFYFYFTLP